MHIVLDMQAFQSPGSRRRGIGRYSLALAKAMVEQGRGHEYTVLLNAAMPDAIELLRAQFDGVLPQDRLVTWTCLSPTASSFSGNAFRRHASEIVRLETIRKLKPDVVHVASLFEGFFSEVVATVPDESLYATAVTLYDLIPLAHKGTYLRDQPTLRWYMERIEQLLKADLLLGISEYSCAEATDLLGIPPERLVNIKGAADNIFARLGDAERLRGEVMDRYDLQRPFIMYTGGFDQRKNIGSLIRAFALLPLSLRCAHQLVIVGDAPPKELADLQALAKDLELRFDEVLFTGYVPDADLVKLYNLCALYVFPSLQEGFGLPALEAMSSGAVVIGASTSSLPEVIGCDEALFDPRDVHAISRKIAEALTDQALRARLLDHGALQSKAFSWSDTAGRALDALEDVVRRRRPPIKERSRSEGSIALLAAPHSLASARWPTAVVFADDDCVGVTPQHSLAEFSPVAGEYERVVVEVCDDVYCAKTLALAAEARTDITLRDPHCGKPLEVLARRVDGRALVASLVYLAGGYASLRAAVAGGFGASVLGDLVTPEALSLLGRSQVVCDASNELAWRSDAEKAISQLLAVEGAAEAPDADWARVALALASDASAASPTRQWFVDISTLAVHDAATGIQRVVRHVLDELMENPPMGFRVEPVRLDDEGVIRYARDYCGSRYFPGERLPPDEPVESRAGDIFLGLDLSAHLIPRHLDVFRALRDRGVAQYYVVYDLLPLLRPDCFDPPGLPLFRSWYESIAEVADGALCISSSVAAELESWLHQARPKRYRPFRVGWFHLGADLTPVPRDDGAGVQAWPSPKEWGDRPTLLMVGTVEPRKGHAQSLAAFEQLWAEGLDVNLLVLGKPGWHVQDLLKRMREHPERNERFFWYDVATDELLLAAYQRSSALLMASEGEGFGLPLIEAAHNGLPLIARDLPVFREIAGEHAFYFSGYESSDLAEALKRWLDLHAAGRAPQPQGMQWNTWREATAMLVETIIQQRWSYRWSVTPVRRFFAFDYRLESEVGHLRRGQMVAKGDPGVLLRVPSISLETGCYQIRLLGGGTGQASLEMGRAGSNTRLLRDGFAADLAADGVLCETSLTLEEDAPDLFLCVTVGSGAQIWLRAIEIVPASSGAQVALSDNPIAA